MTIPASTWTLGDIAAKVRNITGTPSPDQLSNNQIFDYINRYYSFTMPFELKEQVNLQANNFTTVPNTDVYAVSGAFQTDQPMAYANGFPLVFYQDRDIFFQDWPQQYTQDQIGSGNGVQTAFPGTTQASPIIAKTFFITDGTQKLSDAGSVITNETLQVGTAITGPYVGVLGNFPIQANTLQIIAGSETLRDNGAGALVGQGVATGTINYTTGAYSITFNVAVAAGVLITASYSLPTTAGVLTGDGTGTINYLTGVFTATFNAAVANAALVYVNYQAYQPARPQGVLFYNNELTFRPIPDQVYQITLQGFITQIQLTNQADSPVFSEWGQLLAIGASLDIFLDRGDLVAYNNMYPLFKRYENVALGRYVQQFSDAQSVPRF